MGSLEESLFPSALPRPSLSSLLFVVDFVVVRVEAPLWTRVDVGK